MQLLVSKTSLFATIIPMYCTITSFYIATVWSRSSFLRVLFIDTSVPLSLVQPYSHSSAQLSSCAEPLNHHSHPTTYFIYLEPELELLTTSPSARRLVSVNANAKGLCQLCIQLTDRLRSCVSTSSKPSGSQDGPSFALRFASLFFNFPNEITPLAWPSLSTSISSQTVELLKNLDNKGDFSNLRGCAAEHTFSLTVTPTSATLRGKLFAKAPIRSARNASTCNGAPTLQILIGRIPSRNRGTCTGCNTVSRPVFWLRRVFAETQCIRLRSCSHGCHLSYAATSQSLHSDISSIAYGNTDIWEVQKQNLTTPDFFRNACTTRWRISFTVLWGSPFLWVSTATPSLSLPSPFQEYRGYHNTLISTDNPP